MSSLVIVAIPREDDLVWKISSEKVPHLTLMYLGETEDADHAGRMAQFVQHALNINEHGPFYLTVDRRGELGEDKADVLFFENGWDSKWIKSLRGQLLKQNDIRTAFEAQDQFPDWVPHLTLGYPDAPAKELPKDFIGRIYSVEFDRIAVWIGDYEGPEFRLKWPEREMDDDCAIAYSDIGEASVEDLLHYGVKGMQWGRRKEPSVIERPMNNLTKNQKIGVGTAVGVGALAGGPVSFALGGLAGFGVANLHRGTRENLKKNRDQDKAFRKDKKWEKEFKKDKRFVDVHNDAADHMNAFLPSYNKKYDGVDLTKDPAKMKEYEDGYFKENNTAFAKSYSKIYGESPSGNYKVSVIPGTDKVVLHNKKVDPSEFDRVEHAAEQEEPLMTFRLTQDKDTWHILKVEPVNDTLEQTATRGAEFIEHFGTKGMRWGVRKEQLKSGAKAVGRGLEKVGTALADADFENAATNPNERARMEIIDKADEAFVRTDLPKINAKPEYMKASKLRNRLRHPRDPMTKQYRQEVKDTYIQRLEHAANTTINASGTRQYTIRERGWELPAEGGALPQSKHYWEVSTRPVSKTAAHAADAHDDVTLLEVLMDEDGFITGTKQVTESDIAAARPAVHSDIQTVHSTLMHRVELGEEFIKHYGTKGMKWGQRKAEFKTNKHNRRVATEEALREKRPAEDVRAYGTIGSSKRKKAAIDTKGGFDHPPTEDAIKVESHRQKMKKSGVKALSNKELQEVAARLNLEQQVHTLESKQPKSLGKKFVEGVLNMGSGGKGKKNQGGSALGGMAVKKLMKVAF